MGEPYNLFTGQSLERLTALSDGVFAVAMTLLVLDVRVPASAALASSEQVLWGARSRLFVPGPRGRPGRRTGGGC